MFPIDRRPDQMEMHRIALFWQQPLLVQSLATSTRELGKKNHQQKKQIKTKQINPVKDLQIGALKSMGIPVKSIAL